jgi:anti-sigma-K factor RskA
VIRGHDESMLELAALRAIDALEPDEAELIDRHLIDCEECQAEYARSRAAGSALAFSTSTPAPPELRDRVLSRAVRVTRVRRWYQQTTGRVVAAAAVVLVAVGSWFAIHEQQPEQRWAAHCTDAAASDCGDLVAGGGMLRLDARGLATPPTGKVYQAWVIPPKQKPIPEPTFSVDSSGAGSVAIAAVPAKGDIVAVTLEPAGGSKQPTSKPLLVATIE